MQSQGEYQLQKQENEVAEATMTFAKVAYPLGAMLGSLCLKTEADGQYWRVTLMRGPTSLASYTALTKISAYSLLARSLCARISRPEEH